MLSTAPLTMRSEVYLQKNKIKKLYRGLVSHSPYSTLAMATTHIGTKLILKHNLT